MQHKVRDTSQVESKMAENTMDPQIKAHPNHKETAKSDKFNADK